MRAGTIFLVTTGEYSDYGIYATLRARVEFDFDVELAQWLKVNEDENAEYGFSTDKFMSSLVLSGKVEEITIPKLHLSNYSTAQEKPEADAHPAVANAQTWVTACCECSDCLEHPELGVLCGVYPDPRKRRGLPISDNHPTKGLNK